MNENLTRVKEHLSQRLPGWKIIVQESTLLAPPNDIFFNARKDESTLIVLMMADRDPDFSKLVIEILDSVL